MSEQRARRLVDLVGQVVDLYLIGYLIGVGCGGEQVLRGATVVYADRSWIGIVLVSRGVRHEVHTPKSAVSRIDIRTSVRRRRGVSERASTASCVRPVALHGAHARAAD